MFSQNVKTQFIHFPFQLFPCISQFSFRFLFFLFDFSIQFLYFPLISHITQHKFGFFSFSKNILRNTIQNGFTASAADHRLRVRFGDTHTHNEQKLNSIYSLSMNEFSPKAEGNEWNLFKVQVIMSQKQQLTCLPSCSALPFGSLRGLVMFRELLRLHLICEGWGKVHPLTLFIAKCHFPAINHSKNVGLCVDSIQAEGKILKKLHQIG